MTEVGALSGRFLPPDEEHGGDVEPLLSDNEGLHCGRPRETDSGPFLAIRWIEHRRTAIGSPQTGGLCDRYHRAVMEEILSIAFCRTLCERVAQTRVNLNRHGAFNHRERSHQGYRTKGRRP